MKKQIIFSVGLMFLASISNQIFAQTPSAAAKTAGYDLKKGTKLRCAVVSSEGGCSLSFQKIEMDYSDARKQGSGQLDYFVSSVDNSLTEIISPRDAASGLATGKRQHKPIARSSTTIDQTQSPPTAVDGAVSREASAPSVSEVVVTKSMDESTSSSSGSGMGSGKASFQDLHFMVKSAGKTISKSACDDWTCDISTDLPDGDYTLVCSWSWGASNAGSMSSGSGMGSGKATSKRCSVDFLLHIENGDCVAINEKGLPGEKKPNKTKTNNPK